MTHLSLAAGDATTTSDPGRALARPGLAASSAGGKTDLFEIGEAEGCWVLQERERVEDYVMGFSHGSSIAHMATNKLSMKFSKLSINKIRLSLPR